MCDGFGKGGQGRGKLLRGKEGTWGFMVLQMDVLRIVCGYAGVGEGGDVYTSMF